MSEQTLRCRVCRHRKAPEHFSKDATTPTGHVSICKPCDRRRLKRLYRNSDRGAQQRARSRALNRLRRRHADEYLAIYEEELNR